MWFTCLLLTAIFAFSSRPSNGTTVLSRLRCEYLENPVGVDSAKPRLSWIIGSTRRGERQTAYRILVATSNEMLAQDRGDAWDTGKVVSESSIQIEYAGKQLVSAKQYWWKVRVWDRDDKPSKWSNAANWTMGLLEATDWIGNWLSFTPESDDANGSTFGSLTLDDCHWLWSSEPGNEKGEKPIGVRYFAKTVDLPSGTQVKSARSLVAADDQFEMSINGKPAAKSNGEGFAWRTAVLTNIAPFLQGSRADISIRVANTAVSPAGLLACFVFVLDNGNQVTVKTDGTWRVAESADMASAVQATDLGSYGVGPWVGISTGDAANWAWTNPSPIFRKTFQTEKPVERALLFICGLGLHEARLNGNKVGDDVLDPAFTRYDRRCLYVVHDVTNQLKPGKNALGVMLGNGYYNQHSRDAWDFDKAPWRDRPRVLAQLRIEYVDGTNETVATDDTWKATGGPVVRDGIRNGEWYDARRTQKGWDTPEFNDNGWKAAEIVPAPKGKLAAQSEPPIRVVQTIKPIIMTEPKPGVYIFDMGQAFAGWSRLKVKGKSGDRVVLRYGERLDAQGNLSQAEIATLVYRGPFQTDSYTLRGGGVETWEPHFTYHGFRYVEVTGFPGQPSLDSLQGRVVHTSFESTGSFECSNALLNAIQRCTLWSYRSNFVGIPTDCPQREKNGWTGDAQLACEQAMFNWDNAAGYEKWMNDFKDEQRPNGEFPGIVPTSGWGYGTGPAWDSAYLIIPWTLYLYRDDTRILAAHYAGMKRYVDYLASRSHDGIVDYGLGDWVPYKTDTPVAVTSTAYYYKDAQIVASAAKVLGKSEDAAKYADLADEIQAAFRARYIKADGSVANNSQTALSCAVFMGLADPETIKPIVEKLNTDVESKGNHLDTGILGARYLFHTLSENGKHETAYKVATQTTEPSYGDWIKKGATTLWEDWLGAASLNHIMFGDISAWFYRKLAGINLDSSATAFRRFVIQPLPAGDLTYVNAHVDSPYGRIGSSWRKANGLFTLNVTIPVGTTATICVPSNDSSKVMESGNPAKRAVGVKYVGIEDGCCVIDVESGSYSFTAPIVK